MSQDEAVETEDVATIKKDQYDLSPAHQVEVIEESKPLLADSKSRQKGKELGAQSTEDGLANEVKEANVDAVGDHQATSSPDQEHLDGSVVESVEPRESLGEGASVEGTELAVESGQVEGDDDRCIEADEQSKEATKAPEEASSAEADKPSDGGQAPSQGTAVDGQAEKEVIEAQKEEPSSAGEPEQADAGLDKIAVDKEAIGGAQETEQTDTEGTGAVSSLDQSSADKEATGGVQEPEGADVGERQGTEAVDHAIEAAQELEQSDAGERQVKEAEKEVIGEAQEQAVSSHDRSTEQGGKEVIEAQEGTPGEAVVSHDQAAGLGEEGTEVQEQPPVAADVPSLQELVSAPRGLQGASGAAEETEQKEVETQEEVDAGESQGTNAGDKEVIEDEGSTSEAAQGHDDGEAVISHDQAADQETEVAPRPAEETEHEEVETQEAGDSGESQGTNAEQGDKDVTEAQGSTASDVQVGEAVISHDRAADQETEAQEQLPVAADVPSMEELVSTSRGLEVAPGPKTDHKDAPETQEAAVESAPESQEDPVESVPTPDATSALEPSHEQAPSSVQPTQQETEHKENETQEAGDAGESQGTNAELGENDVIEAQGSTSEAAQGGEAVISHDQAADRAQEQLPVAADVSPVETREIEAQEKFPVAAEVPSVLVVNELESTDKESEVGPDAAEETEHKDAPETQETPVKSALVPQEDSVEPATTAAATSALKPSHEQAPSSVEPTQPEADRGEGDISHDQVAEGIQEPPVPVEVPSVAVANELESTESEIGPGAAEETEHKEMSEVRDEAAAAGAAGDTRAAVEAEPKEESMEPQGKAVEPEQVEGTTADQSAEQQGDKEVDDEASKEHDGGAPDIINAQMAEQGDKGTGAQEEPPVAAEVPIIEDTNKELEVVQQTEAAKALEEDAAQPVPEAQEEGTAAGESSEQGDKGTETQEEPPIAAEVPIVEDTNRELEVGQQTEAQITSEQDAVKPVPEALEEATATGESLPEAQKEATAAAEAQEEAIKEETTSPLESPELSTGPEADDDQIASRDLAAEQGDDKGFEAQEPPPVAAKASVIEDSEKTDKKLEAPPGQIEETKPEGTTVEVEPEHKEESTFAAVEPEQIDAVTVERGAEEEAPVAAEDEKQTGERAPEEDKSTQSINEPKKEAADAVEPGIVEVQDDQSAAPETASPVPEGELMESPQQLAASDAKEEEHLTGEVNTKAGQQAVGEGESRSVDSISQPAASEATTVENVDTSPDGADLQAAEVSSLSAEDNQAVPPKADDADAEKTERSLDVSRADEEPGEEVDNNSAGSAEASELSSMQGIPAQPPEAESTEVTPEAKAEAGVNKVDEVPAARDVQDDTQGSSMDKKALDGARKDDAAQAGDVPLVDSSTRKEGKTKETDAAETFPAANEGFGQNAAVLTSAGGEKAEQGGKAEEQKVAAKTPEAVVPLISREADPGTLASLNPAGGQQAAVEAKLEEPEATFEDAEDLDAPGHADVSRAQGGNIGDPKVMESARKVPTTNASDGSDKEAAEEYSTDEGEKPVQSSGGIVGGIVGAALKAIGFGKSTTKPSKKKRMKMKKQMEKLASKV